MKKALPILLAALAVLCSCAENFSPTIRITPSLNYVPYTGGTVDVTIMTELPWKVVLEEGCPATVSKVNGVGDDVVRVDIPATENWTTSCVKVQFYCRSTAGSSYKYAYITQGYKPYISVSGEAPTLPAEGGILQLYVTANAPWTASSDTPGVTFQPAGEGIGSFTVNVNVPANTTGAVRKITVIFAIDGDSDSFSFYQYR
ncbi:MAG: BACON domain-containing protein [Bacteroidales bacterium]|nr:BACON domain-containing protein [Bacteroidales bacterium]